MLLTNAPEDLQLDVTAILSRAVAVIVAWCVDHPSTEVETVFETYNRWGFTFDAEDGDTTVHIGNIRFTSPYREQIIYLATKEIHAIQVQNVVVPKPGRRRKV